MQEHDVLACKRPPARRPKHQHHACTGTGCVWGGGMTVGFLMHAGIHVFGTNSERQNCAKFCHPKCRLFLIPPPPRVSLCAGRLPPASRGHTTLRPQWQTPHLCGVISARGLVQCRRAGGHTAVGGRRSTAPGRLPPLCPGKPTNRPTDRPTDRPHGTWAVPPIGPTHMRPVAQRSWGTEQAIGNASCAPQGKGD